MKQQILITKTLFPGIAEKLGQYFEVSVSKDGKLGPEQFREALQGKTGVLLGGGEKIDEAVLASVPGLRAVCVPAAGYNNVDVEALTRAGVIVTNAPGLVDEDVADFTWGVLISAARGILPASQWLQGGDWKASAGSRFFGIRIHGKTLGIIGMGGIGQAIARRAPGFGMNVLYYNRRPLAASLESGVNARYVSKEEILGLSDFLILALPYTPASYHLIGVGELAAMRSSAILVNIARGGLIDEAALADALKEGRLAGAALDVFEAEPVVYPGLMGLPNTVLTPHIAGAIEASQYAMANLAADNLIAALGYGPDAGNPPSILNPEVLRGKE